MKFAGIQKTSKVLSAQQLSGDLVNVGETAG